MTSCRLPVGDGLPFAESNLPFVKLAGRVAICHWRGWIAICQVGGDIYKASRRQMQHSPHNFGYMQTTFKLVDQEAYVKSQAVFQFQQQS